MLPGCASRERDLDTPYGAAVGAAGGAAVGAFSGGVGGIERAPVGAAIDGLAGAVWADRNNDGYTDGYIYNGQYYLGAPYGYDPTLGRVATGAAVGGALGAGAGALIPGVSVLEGAIGGAVVGGLAGAIWSDQNSDGRVDGYMYNGQYYAGTPQTNPPMANGSGDYTSVPPPAVNGGHGDDPLDYEIDVTATRRAMRLSAVRDLSSETVSLDASSIELAQVQAWFTANGTLTPSALKAIVAGCLAAWGELTSDCEAAVNQGAGEFRAVPVDARKEFALLFQQGCSADRSAEDCFQRMEANRRFRSLPRGRLEPQPMKMDEGKRTRFTVLILDRGEIRGTSGRATDIGVDISAPAAGSPKPLVVMPYSARMCFWLTPEDALKARVELDRRPGRTIEDGKVCMNVAEGGGGVKYDPSWWVTPMTGEDLRLFLNAEHFIGKERRDFPYEPRPLVIDVVPKPSLWDRVDAFIRRATATVNLAIGLAEALGVLFTAIAAWGIWKLIKRRRSDGAPSR